MNPITRLRDEIALFSPNKATRSARRSYYAAGGHAIEILGLLETPDARIPAHRAGLIADLAALESEMAAHVRYCAWNTAIDYEQADTHATTAKLLDLIASTENTNSTYGRGLAPIDWEDAFGHVFDLLADAHDPATRAELMTRLYIAAHPVLDGDVAEIIATLERIYTRQALADAKARKEAAL